MMPKYYIAQNSEMFDTAMFESIESYMSWCRDQVLIGRKTPAYLSLNAVYEVNEGQMMFDGVIIDMTEFHKSLFPNYSYSLIEGI